MWTRMQAANAAIAKDRRKEKENMSEFIAKKRDMFLVQARTHPTHPTHVRT